MTLFIFLFPDCHREIVNLSIYKTKNSLMMPWSMEQKIFCVKTYYETKSFQIVQARFRTKFSFNKFPKRSQIFKLFKMFETHGTCGDRRVTVSSPSGPSITIRTPDNVTRVQESVGRSPSNSLRRSQELGISVSS